MSRVKRLQDNGRFVAFILLKNEFDRRAARQLSRAGVLPNEVTVHETVTEWRVGPFPELQLARQLNTRVNARSQRLRHRAQRKARIQLAA